MRKLCLFLASLLSFGAVIVTDAVAQATAGSEKSGPYNFQQRAVVELKGVQQEIVRLAQAMPQEKYTWRPGEGVRSVSEVYLHMAAANFGLTALTGATPYPGFKFQGFEKSTTDKAQIVDLLNKSFEYAETNIGNLSDADLVRPIKFQNYANVGDMVLHIVAHAHEHLGQSIAYARVNGIVPPWTAERQQQQQGAPRPLQ